VLAGSVVQQATDYCITSYKLGEYAIEDNVCVRDDFPCDWCSDGVCYVEPPFCPFIYSWNGSEYSYDTQIIYKLDSKEKESLQYRLLEKAIENGEIKLQIREEEHETSFIDYLFLEIRDSMDGREKTTKVLPFASSRDLKKLLKEDNNYLVTKFGDIIDLTFVGVPELEEGWNREIWIAVKGYYALEESKETKRKPIIWNATANQFWQINDFQDIVREEENSQQEKSPLAKESYPETQSLPKTHNSLYTDFIEITVNYFAYASDANLVSANLLEGKDVTSVDYFDYNITALPSGTALKVQFSQDNSSWFDSSGTENGLDTMSLGYNSIDLSSLGWTDANFYYKIQFTSDGSNTPILDDINLSHSLSLIGAEGCVAYVWDSVGLRCCGDDNSSDNFCNIGGGSCTNGSWNANHCFDGVQNCDEQGVDCGGSDCVNLLNAVLNQPNGNQYINGTYSIDFNVRTCASAELHAKIAFSSTPGAFTETIAADVNLNDYANDVNLNCDNSDWTSSTNCTYSWNTEQAPDGYYYIDLNVWLPGKENITDSSNDSFYVDNTAPTPSPPTIAGIAVDSNAQLTITATTASDAAAGLHATPYDFNVNGSWHGWQASTSYVHSSLSANTQYCYTVRYRDVLGNTSGESSLACAYTLPNNPVPASSSHTVNQWSNDTTIDLTCSGAASSYYYVWDQNTDTSVTTSDTSWNGSTITKTATSNGNWYLHVIAVNPDNAYNAGGTVHLGPFKIDTTSPTTSDDANTQWQSTNQTITLSASDSLSGVASTYYCVDDVNSCVPSTSGSSVDVSCSSGSVCERYVRYRSVDVAGNSEVVRSVLVRIDKQAPSTSDDVNVAWQSSDVNVVFSASDGLGCGLSATCQSEDQTVILSSSDGVGSGVASTVYCVDDVNACSPSTGGTSVDVNCGSGSFCQTYVRYRSTDNVGNVSSVKSVLVTVDKQAPSTSDDVNVAWQSSDMVWVVV